MASLRLLCVIPLAACAASTNDVTVSLAPDVVSSLDGKLAVHTVVLADREPTAGAKVELTVDYTDRNGTTHAIAPVDGKTDSTGVFDAELDGLQWDGTGAVTAAVPGTKLTDVATFAVLDRTPPQATIEPPANNTVRIGTDVTIMVHVTDEIGVSQVWFEWGGNQGRQRSTVVASGATDAMIPFDFQVPDTAGAGTTISLYALAEDLSGNQGAAMSIDVTAMP